MLPYPAIRLSLSPTLIFSGGQVGFAKPAKFVPQLNPKNRSVKNFVEIFAGFPNPSGRISEVKRVSESARKARFSSPACSGQSLGCFAKRRVPADGVRGRGGIPGDEPKLTSLWPVLNRSSGLKTEPVAPVKPVQTSAPLWRTGCPARKRSSLPSQLVLPVRAFKDTCPLSVYTRPSLNSFSRER